MQWQYLTTWQAATDQHRIIELFKPVFPAKWLTTGVSKGGQTVMFHSYYYPDDVDARVPYVAPLNFGPEDARFKPFLENVGTPECRQRVFDFQKLALERFDSLFPRLLSLAEERGKNKSVVKIVRPEGSHSTRINNLPDEQKELVFSKLEKWLEVTPVDL